MTILTRTLEAVSIGAARSHRALAMFPLVRPNGKERAYLTLDEALDRKTVRVSEVSEGGSVPELCFVNRGDRPVLLIDGEELVGAKQNRVLNLTILVPAGQTVVIPVSCVEAGRWRTVSREFSSSKQVMSYIARAKKSSKVSRSLSSSGRPMSDQREVWDDMAALMDRYGVKSPTSRMTDAFTERDSDIDGYVEALKPVPDQVGAVFALAGEVQGLELFDDSEVLEKLLPKLVRSWALDALHLEKKTFEAPTEDAAREFADRLRGARVTSHPGIGLGEDLRIAAEGLAGGGLTYNDELVHLAVFRLDEDQSSEDPRFLGSLRRSMSPASFRRRRRDEN